MGVLIGLDHISLEWPSKVVARDQTIAINEGDRIGIVGRNGDGKTTLLKLICHEVEADTGTLTWRNGISVGMLRQSEEFGDDESVRRAVLGDMPEYIGASNPRIRSIANALLSDIDWDVRVGELSGGQRRRCDLARVLCKDWNIVLLDEPTNHLDMHAIRWLAQHLKHRWPKGSGALLLVTHDRWFLDEVCEHMWEIHDGLIEPFDGGYSAYVQQRVERQRQEAIAEARRQNVLRRELSWLAHGAKARSSKPKFRVEAARALLASDPPVRNPVELRRLAVARLGKQVIELHDIGMRFGKHPVLKDVTCNFGAGDRVGILGENGVGKTTLLLIACGRLRPTAGYVKIGKTVRIGILTQQLEGLSAHDDERMGDLLGSFQQRVRVEGKTQSPQQLAERLGFSRQEMDTFVGELSGGQRRRLALLAVLLQEPNVLVLDEPGNDLDTEMLAQMEALLDEWPGTLLLVTHDRWLMERATDDQYAIIGGHLRHCPGGVEQYLSLLDEQGEPLDAQASNAAGAKTTMVSSGAADDGEGLVGVGAGASGAAPGVVPGAAPSGLSNKERRALKRRFDAVERRLGRLHSNAGLLAEALEAHDPTDYEGLLDLQAQIDAAKAESSLLEDEWLELAETLGIE